MISRRQKSYFDLARRVSKRSDCRCRIGSVLVKSGRVLSIGNNERKIGPEVTRMGYAYSLHAEISACLGLEREDLHGATLYNWRETRRGEKTISKPCKLCQKILGGLGIRQVYYTTGNSFECLKI